MNELEKSDSAYLLHHSKNPIFWKPWTDQTLDLAQKKNKLIILMRDCQVTGGYPRILQVSESSLSKLSQKFTGSKINFVLL